MAPSDAPGTPKPSVRRPGPAPPPREPPLAGSGGLPARIAVLADVHGNMPALEAVIRDLDEQAVDEVLVGGDMVGRGPEGSRVVKRVRELGWPAISGNHEDYLLAFRRREVPDEWQRAREWAAGRWMAAELDDEDVAWIGDLPFSIDRPGLKLVHGTPRTNRDGIGPWTRDREVAGHLAETGERVLACAHTHRALVLELDAGMVVNVGAVGLPFNRDHRAQYAIFTAGGPYGWRVELRQVAYDLERIFEIYETSGFLAAGGVTARLLRMELEHASPLLVPFQTWAKTVEVDVNSVSLERFFEVYEPGQSLREFFAGMHESGASP